MKEFHCRDIIIKCHIN
ncbi:DUF1059 domain-containing protein, partial [Pectobacterium carotovorum]|nr:DUF1059 domain-containing protein [Pectobacterium carotovorum]